MKLYCIPGDLAIITRDMHGCEDNLGRIVRISGPRIDRTGVGATWLIHPITQDPWTYVDWDGQIRADTQPEDIEHPDTWMIPIKPEHLLEAIRDVQQHPIGETEAFEFAGLTQ